MFLKKWFIEGSTCFPKPVGKNQMWPAIHWADHTYAPNRNHGTPRLSFFPMISSCVFFQFPLCFFLRFPSFLLFLFIFILIFPFPFYFFPFFASFFRKFVSKFMKFLAHDFFSCKIVWFFQISWTLWKSHNSFFKFLYFSNSLTLFKSVNIFKFVNFFKFLELFKFTIFFNSMNFSQIHKPFPFVNIFIFCDYFQRN